MEVEELAEHASQDKQKQRSTSFDESEEDLLSDDDDSVDDAQQLAVLEKLEAAVSQNPYNYQAHVEYVTALRKNGLLEKLRSAREAMNALFPLSPSMWQEWTQDEARLISSDEDIAAVEKLYERGLQEYLSALLWSDFLEFTLRNDSDVAQYSSSGISKMRGLYERALTAASLHLAEGGIIWRAYRQYEIDVLKNISNDMEDMKVKQVECIRSLYRRQLCVPSCNLVGTLKDYAEWESQQGNNIGIESDELYGVPTNIASAYQKAVQMYSIREPFEEKVSKSRTKDADLLQNYLLYIALEEGTGDPARVQILYERAVTEFPFTQELWVKYTEYLEKSLKVPAIIVSVYARAVRNCPWVQALWNRYLLALERSNFSETDISKVFQQSLHSGFIFSSPQEYLEHYLTRADGIRRLIATIIDEAIKKVHLTSLRDLFNQAVEFLSTYYPDFVDHSLKLHSYWAHLEANLAHDLVAARGVWENLIKSCGWMVEVWQGFIAMELHLHNYTEARTIYKRSYSRKLEGNGTEVLCEAWIQFEREHGSLEDYDRALSKVLNRLAEVKQLQQQQDAKITRTAGRVTKEAKRDKLLNDKKARNIEEFASEAEKEARTMRLSKKRKNNEKNDSYSVKKKKKRAKFEKSDAMVDERIAHTDEKMSKSIEKAEPTHLEAKSSHLDGQQEQAKVNDIRPENLRSTKKVMYTDECTAFVSRLIPEVTEEDLHEFFMSCGGLKEVRLVKNRDTGKSRGFAYIEFDNEQGLAEAISRNKQKLKGSKIKIARSDPSLVREKEDKPKGNKEQNDNEQTKDKGESADKKRGADSKQGPIQGGSFNPSSTLHRRGGHVQLSGRNTFALPRSVARPLGFSREKDKNVVQDETPKSNEDFRQMLSKH